MDRKTHERYRAWREQGHPAATALDWARYQDRMDEVLGRFEPWTFDADGGYGTFARADLAEPGPYTVRVSIGDDDHPVEWGDIEPSDAEREHARAFYVSIQVLDAEGGEVYQDSIGGIDVIDLPGYMQRDWEDAAAYALVEYLLDGAERFAATEDAERAEWAARDTVTV